MMAIDPQAETQADSGEPSQTHSGGQSRIEAFLGKTLKGKYRIDRVLGQGAMGVVFGGTQLGLDKPVAVKMMRPDSFHSVDSLDRFRREATVVSKLNHPGIAQVLDFGIEEETPFLVMEFVDGKELTDVMETEGPMPPARAVAVIRQLASALEEAHKNGVVHRDIKPQNLRLMRYTQGGPIYLKVLDFGIAKQMESKPGDGKLTATGAVMGTPMYMAPEQAGGTKIDARADQYAVGIVFYELLTGTVPFTGETLTGVLVSHLTKPPPPLPRQIPEPLQKVVMRLLAKSPAERFPDFAAVDQALVACEAACRDVPALSAGKVSPLMAGTPATAPNDRKTLLIGGGALGVAVVCLGLVYLVEAVQYMVSLRSSIGLKVGVLWRHIWRSYALALVVAAGPLALVLTPKTLLPLPLWLMLLTAGVLGLTGWAAGLVVLGHPLRAEVALLARSLAARVRDR